ncbi:hypothetical protein CAC42_30 [Sphaceloma murrayae]|uniref:Pre-mRNA-processing factor 39 n=1 Tax=Sphaceloma murrayae TaxID=2082308 RepID=A0A2K1QS23_9PEZI|nr:hypothetical protein CAC42_30 [Sphaceloma murrayae]
MADYGYGSDEDFSDLRKLNSEVLANPDEFENWEKLVRGAESLEGGLHRNSSPQAIAAARDVYDRFLAKFPLFFGYWKKYADLEFSLAGSEAADFIYERAVASVGISVDLWTNYCNFKLDTCHDPDVNRELFERGAESVGLDFLAHPFWDKYIEFEERLEQPARVFAILGRIIEIPLHQYARYFERYRSMANQMPINLLAPENAIKTLTEDSLRLAQLKGGSQADIERDMRSKLDEVHLQVFHRTQAETTKRWTYEQEIKRPYFHVTELDEAQLANWHKYLDFEESEGDFRRITFLYERCIVTAAHYDDFWFRYARFMWSQDDKVEETRNIYERASSFYIPVARPAIRYQWALFEESNARPSVAAAIYDGILYAMPNHVETLSRYANLVLRQFGAEEAANVYREQLTRTDTAPEIRGQVVAAFAGLMFRMTNDNSAALQIFQSYQDTALDSETFWAGWIDFEQRLAVPQDGLDKYRARVKSIYQSVRTRARLDQTESKNLTKKYMEWLTERGDKADAAREYLDLEAHINGSASVVPKVKSKASVMAGPTNESNGA